MHIEDQAGLAALIHGQRQAALGTLADGAPFVSIVLYALQEDSHGGPPVFLVHTSRLALHTRNMETDPRVSLLIAQPDLGAGDPQALPRVTIQAVAQPIPRESADYERSKECYVARLPDAAFLFSFSDFVFFRLVPTEARYIGGFAKAFTLTVEQIQEALQ
jgi:hypothetical protein